MYADTEMIKLKRRGARSTSAFLEGLKTCPNTPQKPVDTWAVSQQENVDEEMKAVSNSMINSLGCDFSVEKKNFEIHMCFMVIRGKCFYSGIKDSD